MRRSNALSSRIIKHLFAVLELYPIIPLCMLFMLGWAVLCCVGEIWSRYVCSILSSTPVQQEASSSCYMIVIYENDSPVVGTSMIDYHSSRDFSSRGVIMGDRESVQDLGPLSLRTEIGALHLDFGDFNVAYYFRAPKEYVMRACE